MPPNGPHAFPDSVVKAVPWSTTSIVVWNNAAVLRIIAGVVTEPADKRLDWLCHFMQEVQCIMNQGSYLVPAGGFQQA